MSIFSHQSRSSSDNGFPRSRFFARSAGAKGTSKKFTTGFTLIELLVVMSIMVIVTGIMLVKQSKFNSSTILHSLAYSVALSVRQAQVYGTSVLGNATASSNCVTTSGGFYNSTTGSCFASAYGVYIDSSNLKQYILFADLNSNGRYDTGEDVKVFALGTTYFISDFCAATSGVAIASNDNAWCMSSTIAISNLSIVFKRPNPDACFSTNLQAAACAPGGTPVYTTTAIYLQNSGDPGTTRSATINSTGLISAQ